MSLDTQIATILNAVNSHVQKLAYFSPVQMHEPKNAPGNELTCAIFLAALTPIPAASGLDSTTFRLELTARIYKPFRSEPADLVDVAIGLAACAIIGEMSSNFELDGAVRNVDLLGAHGTGLGGRFGYQTIGGGTGNTYRIADVTIPLIINDAFDQGA